VSADVAAARAPITLGVMLAAVMSALDTTVVNIAMPHMQGSLSASPEQITWVITSYIVATAVTTPVSGWLAARLGLKPMLVVTIAGFTVVSALCGMAGNLPEMVLLRALQGVMAAPLVPLCQAVLLNINPPERFGRAMALFTMAIVVAPIVGPIIGSYLTEDLSWRWCFYINIPGGIAAILLLWIFLPQEEVVRRRFDFLGFGSLAVAIASLQLMLGRGPSQDWFSSREIVIEAILAAMGFWIYLAHTATAEHPLFDKALVRDRNFVTSTLIAFVFNTLSFCSLTLFPLMLQGVLGYPVITSGIIAMPRGVAMIVVLQAMGRLEAIVDRRLLIGVGLAFVMLGFWQMAHFDLSMDSRTIVIANILLGVGQGIFFVPISTLSFATIDPALRPDASALGNLIRSLGNGLGVSVIQALTASNGQRMHAALVEHVRPDNAVFNATIPPYLSPSTVEGASALNAEITRQATMVAYVDDFRLLLWASIVCAPLILLLRQPRRPAVAADDNTVLELHA
jgi:DHA2 family multidrug resistance protein